MYRYLIAFLMTLVLPNWMQDKHPDEQHFYRRKFTSKHRAKRHKVKSLWIGSGLIALLFPLPAVLVTVFLFTTFLSFSLMDESG